MPETTPGPDRRDTERAFLDANVIRGQETTNILMSLAHEGAFEPVWTQQVMDEMRRNHRLACRKKRSTSASVG